jgi:hypothetical protein
MTWAFYWTSLAVQEHPFLDLIAFSVRSKAVNPSHTSRSIDSVLLSKQVELAYKP